MVQRAGFEPAKHYALGPHPSPFDHSGTSAWRLSETSIVFHNLGYSKQFSLNNYLDTPHHQLKQTLPQPLKPTTGTTPLFCYDQF